MQMKNKKGEVITEEEIIMEWWSEYFEELPEAEPNVRKNKNNLEDGNHENTDKNTRNNE